MQWLSSASRGTCKLSINEVLQLASKDERVLFVPPHKKEMPPQWAAARNEIMSQMRWIIVLPYAHDYTAAECDAVWDFAFAKETFGHEFHISLRSYAKRPLLATPNLPSSEVNHLLDPATGAGIQGKGHR
jgi:hypothetical protein